MYEVYIFRFIHLPPDRAAAPEVLLCLGQVRYRWIQHRQGLQLFRYS